MRAEAGERAAYARTAHSAARRLLARAVGVARRGRRDMADAVDAARRVTAVRRLYRRRRSGGREAAKAVVRGRTAIIQRVARRLRAAHAGCRPAGALFTAVFNDETEAA